VNNWCKAGMIAFAGIVLACLSPCMSLADGPSTHDGTYNAYLSCDALPFTQPMRNQPFVLTIKNGQLVYSRDVKMPNGVDSTGVSEHGKGTVASDGSVSVSGSAGNNDWNFTSAFQGRFDGAMLHLTGTQSWVLPQSHGGGTFKRNCSITATQR
jgi:hypothetical protein